MKSQVAVNTVFALARIGLWEDCPQEAQIIDVNSNIDYDKVLNLAESLSVVGLVVAGLRCLTPSIPLEKKLKFVGVCQLMDQQNLAMNQFISSLINKTKEAGISAVLVKGQGVAQCYARPQWRTAGDIDLLLDKESYLKAKHLLSPMASHVEREDAKKLHYGMSFGSWTVELHGKMHTDISIKANKIIDTTQKEIFENGKTRVWNNNGFEIDLPDVTNDVILVFSHLIQHFYVGGIGLKQVCDWCRLLWTYQDGINKSVLRERVCAMGLMSEWHVFASFAIIKLGMPSSSMPFSDNYLRYGKKVVRIQDLIVKMSFNNHIKDEEYRKKYPRIIVHIITTFRRFIGFCRISVVFPVNSFRFFMTYLFLRTKSDLQ